MNDANKTEESQRGAAAHAGENPPIRARKRPVEVDAWQWLGDNDGLDKAPAWIREYLGEVYDPDRQMRVRKRCRMELSPFDCDWLLRIPTLEGDHFAGPGDWIIKGVEGELYPCKPDIFEKTYERC